jgi:cytochrome c biogenesis protein CcmG, thiol:disulfide interchange protein DsbE
MGRASRTKRERREAPPPVQSGKRSSDATRLIWVVTGGVAAIVAIVVVVLLFNRSHGTTPPPAANTSAADGNAPAALVKAADAVGFKPTTEAGIGQIEDQPASAAQPSQTATLLPVGSVAPDFTLKTPEGKSISLKSYRGKPVLLEFFATWCPHCNAETPHLMQIAKRFKIVSINGDSEDAASVFAFHRYYGLPYPALLDPSSSPGSFTQRGASGPVTTKYGLQGFPTFYVVNPQGRITWRSDGEQPDAKLRQELERAGQS